MATLRKRRENVGKALFPVAESEEDLRKKYIDCSGCACFSLILFSIVAVAALVVGAIALGFSTRDAQVTIHIKSQEIPISPFGHHLDGKGAPLAMTLPNDLSNYIGITLNVYALDAQPHTITIDSGTLTSTWDGANTVATFGGAIGDGITFRVLSKNMITVQFTKNIVFS